MKWAFVILTLPGALAAAVAPLTCDATADPVQLRSEGLTERVGEIVLTCSALSGDTVTGSLTLFLSAPVTNKIIGANSVDVVMTAETDVGTVPIGGSPLLTSRNALTFGGFSFQLPVSRVTHLRIINIRVANNPSANRRPVTALLSTSGASSIGIRNNPVTVGVTDRGLLAGSSSARIVCLGSPLPEELTFSGLIGKGTRFASLRVTEGFPAAFERRLAGANTGVRVMVRYTGFPAGARLFVPRVIAGSNSLEQTSAGDLGLPASGGRYAPASGGSLLLALAGPTDAVGAGGSPVYTPLPAGSGPVYFDEMSEVALQGGAGIAVYEVMDSNAFTLESAQIPTFIGLPPLQGETPVVASATLSFAPLSTLADASSTAPVPRFADVIPELDCSLLGDCRATYFPKLLVDAPALVFTAPAATPGFYSKHIRVLNDSGGLMNWRATISYRNGTGWLRAFPDVGVNNASITLSAHPEQLAVGRYEAVFTVDAGPVAGTRAFTVSLEVTAAPAGPPAQPPQPTVLLPVVWQTGNAANTGVLPLTPGSLATLKGTRLGGRNVRVTFNDVPAIVLFSSEGQINLVVPPELALLSSAHMVINADGNISAGQTVPLALAAPAIFTAGILNQDGFPNAPNNPELVGRILQVFATGLPLDRIGVITAKIHDREITTPAYAGAAPGLAGVQQVNFTIPDDLPAMASEVLVCGAPLSSPAERTCSPPVQVNLTR
ncbi:MAG: hypothetical protein JJE04_18645 [Acidobacteriia bacterium]|nr:hypothetical protein [Terriglobia bacterium]